jgi:hypothetical protein
MVRRGLVDFANLVSEDSDEQPYHHGGESLRERRVREGTHTKNGQLRILNRPFLFWDGEGVRNPEGDRKPTAYALLGHSGGGRITGRALNTVECLRFICRTGRENPGAIHVGFAFEYDITMMLRNLLPSQFECLKDNGFCHAYGFRIEHVPHKWIQITEYGRNYSSDKRDKTTVRIADIFGFFQCSFVKACKSYIPNHPLMVHMAKIEEGKDARNSFTYEMIDYITEYWETEIQLGLALVEQLREWLYDVDLKITRFHGPGALANYTYLRNGIAKHKNNHANARRGDEAAVYRAARHAYAGGRFELFRMGRIEGPVYGIDINSAYPYGISQLPSLSEGFWDYSALPETIEQFGVYRISFKVPTATKHRQLRTLAPSPLFHRDKNGEITFPWRTDGWYWAPEAQAVKSLYPDHVILEGWVYRGWRTEPFQFVRDMYAQRRIMKEMGVGAQMALKLALNSLYGKMAQRTGWERTGKAPTWHQLEWAGWVTSNTRRMLFDVMWKISPGNLIAVETDGIYTTTNPADLGIHNSPELGGWEVTQYDEMLYLQSGTYFARQGDKWTAKYRGLDPRSLGLSDAQNYLRTCAPNEEWPAIEGITTRFVGYKQALFRQAQNRGPMKVHLGVWETDKKDISVGRQGKRIHYGNCTACKNGATAWDMAHDLRINPRAYGGDVHSYPHDIPWQSADTAKWREQAESEEGYVRL